MWVWLKVCLRMDEMCVMGVVLWCIRLVMVLL